MGSRRKQRHKRRPAAKGFKKSKRSKIEFRQEILSLFSKNSKKPLNPVQVASALGLVDREGRRIIERSLEELVEQGALESTGPGKYKIIISANAVEGVIDATSRGSAYLISDQTASDIYIARENMNHALNKDRVQVEIISNRRSKRLEGRVVDIVERARTKFVGKIEISEKFAFVVTDDPKISCDLFIPPSKLNGAKDGDKVVAEITDWPIEADNPFAEVTDVLGTPGSNEVETLSIIFQYGLDAEFPDEVLAEASRVPLDISDDEIAKRKDFRGTTTFTIDPEDAKDFDDAISFKRIDDQWVELGVHIADVTHYVQPNTQLEKEALSRATSVYLTDRVIPMLPEIISNQVCSLRPNEDKLCFSAVFEINAEGKIRKHWIGRTVIHSDRRFTYEDAQAIIEGGEGDYQTEVLWLNTLAQKMRKQRLSSGAIAFNKSEVRFKLDDKGYPLGIKIKTQKQAHMLIEEFMLLANRTVAESVGNASDPQQRKTFVYRIHDNPDPEKINDLAQNVQIFGYSMGKFNPSKIGDSINKLLESCKDAAESSIIQTLAIRSMAKAVYSTENVGHFGLAFSHYSHFTSPIRRYPDMMVHRLLALYATGAKSEPASKYEDLCKHCSDRERNAEMAERESIKLKQVQYLSDKEGEVFKGTIISVTEWGMYVEMHENLCEGMVSIRDIGGDYYHLDPETLSIKGSKYGEEYRLGDEIMVVLKEVDLTRKQINLELINDGV